MFFLKKRLSELRQANVCLTRHVRTKRSWVSVYIELEGETWQRGGAERKQEKNNKKERDKETKRQGDKDRESKREKKHAAIDRYIEHQFLTSSNVSWRPQADRPLDDNVAIALKALDADSLHRFLREHLGAAPGASQLRADAEANPEMHGLDR